MKAKLITCAFTVVLVFAASSCSNKQQSGSKQTDENVLSESGSNSKVSSPETDVPGEELNSETDVPEEEFTIEAVDLGLSVLWANANIGANGIYEKGDYYAWGESSTKSSYTLDNYFDYYNEVKDNGLVYRDFKVFNKGGMSLMGTKFDTAHNILGGKWRMPTPNEYRELIRKCKLTATTLNDENGLPLKDEKGKVLLSYVEIVGPNGNKIVLPFGGQKEIDEYDKRGGFYWTANMFYADRDYEYAMAACLDFNSRRPILLQTKNKGYGLNIRAVMDRDASAVNIKDGDYKFVGNIGHVGVDNFEMNIHESKVSGKYLYSTANYNGYIEIEGTIDKENNVKLKHISDDKIIGHMEGVFDGIAFHGKSYGEGDKEGLYFKLVIK